jgi:hypothetical protein
MNKEESMLIGETIMTGGSDVCCGKAMEIRVLRSAAGYYIGTRCEECGCPNSRESGYYKTSEAAAKDLKNDCYFRF